MIIVLSCTVWHRNVASPSSTAGCRFRSIAEVGLSISSSQTKHRSSYYDLSLDEVKYTSLRKVIKRAFLRSNLPHKTLFISILFIKPYLLPDITDMTLCILYICTHTHTLSNCRFYFVHVLHCCFILKCWSLKYFFMTGKLCWWY